MNKAMVVALAALVVLMTSPLPGFARNSHSQGSYTRGQSASGSYQQGSQPRGSYSRGGYGQGVYRGAYPYGGYRQGGYSHGGYRYGGYPYRGYRHGGYPYAGYRYGGYPYWGYRYGGYYPYRSSFYYSGGVWIGPGWGPWWGPAWPYYYPYYSSPPVVIQQSPTEYIQRDQQTEEPEYWYYCNSPKGYYPDIQRCPSGWIRGTPSEQPPPSDVPPAQ